MIDGRVRNRKILDDLSDLLDIDNDQLARFNSNSNQRIFHIERSKPWVKMLKILVFVILAVALFYCFRTNSSLAGPRWNRHYDQFAISSQNPASSDMIYDVAVLGAGPAGLTAALFAARSGLSVVLFGSKSGLLSETPRLENFPGYASDASTGMDWLKITRKQAEQVGAQFALPGLLIKSILPTNDTFSLISQLDTTYNSLSVIVATGATPRRLSLPKEEDLWGISIHNCAICDGSLYNNKTVLIVGGGDAALDAAVYLSRSAKHVVLIHRRRNFTAKQSMRFVTEKNNIEILTPFVVTEWETNAQQELKGAHLKHTETGKTKMLSCDGVFLMIGAIPNTKWFGNILELDNGGLIRLQDSNTMATRQTSLPGVFAAGEVTDDQYRQAITASAEGAQAALDAERWLRQVQKTAKTNDPGLIVSPKKISLDRMQAHKKTAPLPQQGSTINAQSKPGENPVDCDFGKARCMAEVVNQYPLVVFSSYTCPECHRLLELLKLVGVKEPHIIELGAHRNIPQDVRYQLTLQAGSRSVPSLFIGGESIGGYIKTKRLQDSGKLSLKLKKSGAVLSI